MEEHTPKKKRKRRKKAEEPEASGFGPGEEMPGSADPEAGPEGAPVGEAETPAWDEAAQTVEAALVPPPPGGSCGCGDTIRVEMLNPDGTPSGQLRRFGYKVATAQVGARRARYVE